MMFLYLIVYSTSIAALLPARLKPKTSFLAIRKFYQKFLQKALFFTNRKMAKRKFSDDYIKYASAHGIVGKKLITLFQK